MKLEDLNLEPALTSRNDITPSLEVSRPQSSYSAKTNSAEKQPKDFINLNKQVVKSKTKATN